MLIINATDINGKKHNLTDISYLTINRDESIPADDMTAVICCEKGFPELDTIEIIYNGNMVLNGIVDEQQMISDCNGVYMKLTARSFAALLLDNECKPVSYRNPTETVIVNKHLKPNGLDVTDTGEGVLASGLNVSKGMTHWQVVNSFCKSTYGSSPRVNPDKTVSLKGIESHDEILFSNSEGQNYISIKENNKRYKRISSVYVKLSELGNYNTCVTSAEALKRNIRRERYIDGTAVKDSLNVAEKILENGRKDSYEITVVCPNGLPHILGAKARLKDSLIGSRDDLYVSSLCYKLSPNGELTTVILKKQVKGDL